MVETVLSEDDVSEVTLLRDELIFKRKEQTKVTQAILDQFLNLNKGSKIADKGADMMTKLVLAQTNANFNPVPKDATNTAMGEWKDNNHAILAAAPRNIDGTLMIDMKGVVLANTSKHNRARSTKHGMIMRELLKNAKLIDCINSLKESFETNDGVLLMDSICEHLLPLATTRILEILIKIGLCM